MIAALAEILKARIGELPWIQRYGGLVVAGTKPVHKTNQASGAQELAGRKVYPIGCDVNSERCWETGTYKYFVPDDSFASLAFFVDNGGCQVLKTEGPKAANTVFSFDVKFLCWMNVRKLGFTDCNLSALAAPQIVGAVMGSHTAAGTAYEEMYQNINVLKVRQLVKNPIMFEPFSFAKEGEARGLFLFPHDYFGLNISGQFTINKNCLPELVAPDFEFVTDQLCTTP